MFGKEMRIGEKRVNPARDIRFIKIFRFYENFRLYFPLNRLDTQIDLSEANIYFDFHNYQFITKPRNKYGGGVAILIKEGIEFIQDFSYEEFNSELLCIKMNLGKNSELFVFSLYKPPNVLLNFENFKTCRNYILGGDLNARTKQIGCVGENENGI
ncbi:hypothetical protein BpHYR1_025885, partial [Brachionus plicatilis]